MSATSALLRDRRFHDWYLNKMVEFAGRSTGEGKEGLRTKLADSLVQEMNALHFILENIYPNSRPSNDDRGYLFVTEPIEHDLWMVADEKLRFFYPGKFTLSFRGLNPLFEFLDEPTFKHGHILEDSKNIKCYGHFQEPYVTATNSGFAGLLAEMHTFATKSRYGTRIHGKPSPHPNA